MSGTALSQQTPPHPPEGAPRAAEANIGVVIVTAQKREQTLLDVPIAVSSFSGELLEQRSINNLEQVAQDVPNFRVFGTPSITVVRGIRSPGGGYDTDNASATYVDGLYSSGRLTGNDALYDVDRIEVLRGPQGTLYGRSTVSGAINIISRRPDDNPELDLRAEIAEEGFLRLRGTVNGSIAEGLSGRLSILKANDDGYIENKGVGENIGYLDSLSGRAALRYQSKGGTDANLVIDHGREESAPLLYLDGSTPGAWEDLETTLNTPRTRTKTVNSVALWLDHSFGDFDVTSITGYRASDGSTQNDIDAGPVDTWITLERDDQKVYSQELRVARDVGEKWAFIAGLFALHEDYDTTILLDLGGFGGSGLFENYKKLDEYAAFGEVTYRFTEAWSATLGGRLSRTDFDYQVKQTNFSPAFIPPLTFVTNRPLTVFTDEESAFSGKFLLQYQPSDLSHYYLSIAQGYRPGGPNGGIIPAPLEAQSRYYENEFSFNYEIGYKAARMLGDTRLSLGLTAFYLDYQDLQGFVSELSGLVTYVTNAGEAHSAGVELDAGIAFANGLAITGAYGFNDTEYSDYANCTAGGANCAGNWLYYAPRHTASLRVDYLRPVSDTLEILASADASYTGTTYLAPTNIEDSKRDPYTIVNVNLGLRAKDGTWSVALYGKNVFDERYFIDYAAGPDYMPGAPSRFGVVLNRKF